MLEIRKIPNQIINGSLTPLNRNNITAIVLHHMANATWNVKDVEAYHVNTLGWNAIGYNYFIAFDGTVYEGRGLNVGAHVSGYNSTTIGIGFQGNYQSGTKVALSVMTDEQFNAGVELIQHIKSLFPKITRVDGHRAFQANACPGDKFPLEEMINGRRRGTMINTPEQAIDKIIASGAEIDKAFWVSACRHIKYLDELFIKIANAMR